MTSHRRSLVIVLLAVLVVLATVLVAMQHREQLYASYVRPDGLYRIDVYRRSSLVGTMPGQSGDAPGRALLQDKNGRVLGEVALDMVQLAQNVDWSADSVSIRAVVGWPADHVGREKPLDGRRDEVSTFANHRLERGLRLDSSGGSKTARWKDRFVRIPWRVAFPGSLAPSLHLAKARDEVQR